MIEKVNRGRFGSKKGGERERTRASMHEHIWEERQREKIKINLFDF